MNRGQVFECFKFSSTVPVSNFDGPRKVGRRDRKTIIWDLSIMEDLNFVLLNISSYFVCSIIFEKC